jgi:S-adenosylmethionine hydrolase
VFAPAAAALARGARLDDLGPALAEPQRFDRPQPRRVGQDALGEVVALDAFGNATTNLPGAWVVESSRVVVAGLRLALHRTYGDVGPGEPLALIDSEGRVEVAVRNGSAADQLRLSVGTAVRLLGLA